MSRLGFAAVLLAANLTGCETAAPGVPTSRTRSAQALDHDDVLRATLEGVRDAYLELDATNYRVAVFHLLAGLGPEDGTDPYKDLLVACLDVESSGGIDGLEPLLLYAADALANSGDPEDRNWVSDALAQHSWSERSVDTPNEAFIVPLGRASTSVFLDVRAEVARILLDEVMEHSEIPEGGIDGLLASPEVNAALCDMSMRVGADRGLEVSSFQQWLDERRQENCGSSNLPGGPGAQSPTSGGLGSIAEGACFDASFDFGRTDPTALQIQALIDCAESQNTSGSTTPGPDVGMGPLGLLLLAPLASGVEITLAGSVLEMGGATFVAWAVHESTLVGEARDAMDTYTFALGELDAAIAEYSAAADDVREAEKNLELAEIQAEIMDNEVGGQSQAGAKKVEDAKAELTAAKTRLQGAERTLTEKSQQAEAAREVVQRRLDDASNPLEPMSEFSEDCYSAFNQLFEGTQYALDLNQAIEDADPENGVDPRVALYSEDSDFGLDALELMPCGTDPATASPPRNVECGLINCAQGDPHCACGGDSIPSELQIRVLNATEAACNLAFTCASGEPARSGPFGCSCEEDGEGMDIGDFGPDLTGPPVRFLDAAFGSLSTVHEMEMSLTERAAAGALRADTTSAQMVVGLE